MKKKRKRFAGKFISLLLVALMLASTLPPITVQAAEVAFFDVQALSDDLGSGYLLRGYNAVAYEARDRVILARNLRGALQLESIFKSSAPEAFSSYIEAAWDSTSSVYRVEKTSVADYMTEVTNSSGWSYNLEMSVGYEATYVKSRIEQRLESLNKDMLKTSSSELISETLGWQRHATYELYYDYVPQALIQSQLNETFLNWLLNRVPGETITPKMLFDRYGTHFLTQYSAGGWVEASVYSVNESINRNKEDDTTLEGNIIWTNKVINDYGMSTSRHFAQSRAYGGSGGFILTSDPEAVQNALNAWAVTLNKDNWEILTVPDNEIDTNFMPIWDLIPEGNEARFYELVQAYIAEAQKIDSNFMETLAYRAPLTPNVADVRETPGAKRPDLYGSVPANATRVSTRAQLDTALNSTSASAYVILDNDIDLSGSAWTPKNNFRGTLDGNGYRITGLHTTATISSQLERAGLFGTVSNGIIIRYLNVEITGGISSQEPDNVSGTININGTVGVKAVGGTRAYAGGLIGLITNGTVRIEDCSVTGGVVYAHSTRTGSGGGSATSCAGGLIGDIQGGTVYIDRSYATCDVYSTSRHYYNGMLSGCNSISVAGGLIGRVYGSPIVNIFDCYVNENRIYTRSYTNDGANRPYSGGIAGQKERSGSTLRIDRTYNGSDSIRSEEGSSTKDSWGVILGYNSGNANNLHLGIHNYSEKDLPTLPIPGWDFNNIWAIGSNGLPIQRHSQDFEVVWRNGVKPVFYEWDIFPREISDVMTIYYKDASIRRTDITKQVSLRYDFLNANPHSKVQLIYGDLIGEIAVTVLENPNTNGTIVDKTIRSIFLSQTPVKTVYAAGDTFDPSGMIVMAGSSVHYNTWEIDGWTYTPAGPLALTDTEITVSYGTHSTTLPIMVTEPPAIRVGRVSGCPGETVILPVIVSNSPLLASLEFAVIYPTIGLTIIGYPEYVLTLEDAVLPDGSDFSFVMPPNLSSGAFFALSPKSVSAVDPNGVVINLVFKIAGNAIPGTYNIILSDLFASDAIDKEILFVPEPGTITVIETMYGDFTNNGRVDGTDVLWIQRYMVSGRNLNTMLLNWPEGDSIGFSIPAGDFTNNGRIDGTDILWIQRYMASGRDAFEMVKNFPEAAYMDFSHLGIINNGMTTFQAANSILLSQAGNSVTMIPSSTTVSEGGTFTVMIGLDLEPGVNISAFDFILNYDPALLRLIPNETQFPGNLTGIVIGSLFALSPKGIEPQTSGDIIRLTFEVLDDSQPTNIGIAVDYASDSIDRQVNIPDPTPLVINPPGVSCANGHTLGAEATCTEPQVCLICGVELASPIPDVHDMKFIIKTEPTCEDDGYDLYECTHCDKPERRNIVPALGHSYTVFVETVAPTCVAGGHTTFKCVRCIKTDNFNPTPIDPDAHDMEFSHIVGPTCLDVGYDLYKCSRCPVTERHNVRPPLDHAFTVPIETIAPTCVAQGYTVFKCERCEVTRNGDETPIDPGAHNMDPVGRVTLLPTCVDTGERTYDCLRQGCVHFTTEPILPTPADPDAHAFTVFVETIPPTCTEKGYTTFKCERCDATVRRDITDERGHAWDAGVVTTQPTCTAAGVRTFTCTRPGCGVTRTESIPELGHDWDAGVVTTQPTCTVAGVRTFTCLRQGCGATRIESIAPHGHEYDTVTFPPTCTEPGETASPCKHCGDSSSTVIPALGHDWDGGAVTTPPTEEREGVRTFTCTRCGDTREEPIPALPAKSVSVGAQSGTLTAGGAGTVSFPVATANIADGAYAVTVSNLPTGVTVQGQVAIANNAGTLTLAGGASTVAGATSTLTLTIDGATSEAFTLTIAQIPPPPVQQFTPPVQQTTPTPTQAPVNIAPIGVPMTEFQEPIANPFPDVSPGAWYYSDVMFVFRKGLMTGTSDSSMVFSPALPTTRGMIVTILYRLCESPDAGELANPFSDVAVDAWYADAVKWAAANGIAAGLGDGKFGPGDEITREQLATMLDNYARFAGLQLPATKEYQAFADGAAIADFARGAVERLFKAGVVGGKQGNTFDPKGSATRAEVASMLARFTAASGK